MNVALLQQHGTHKPCTSCGVVIEKATAAFVDAPAILGCAAGTDFGTETMVSFFACVCPSCGVIQLHRRFDASLYEVVHSHATGKVWADHRDALARFAMETLSHRQGSPERVLEIGPSCSPVSHAIGGAGVEAVYVDLMDQAPFPLRHGETYRKTRFPPLANLGSFDLIVASHVLEHAEDLCAFMLAIRSHLSATGIGILSTPNFKEWLYGEFWNAITPEHLSYPLESNLKDLCIRIGLGVEFGHFRDHSVFMAVWKAEPQSLNQATDAAETERLLTSWVDSLNARIGMYEQAVGKSDGAVVIAGASHLAQYVYLMSETIRGKADFVIDNAQAKHGCRLYGTPLRVHPFRRVTTIPKPVVVIPMSPYAEEMA